MMLWAGRWEAICATLWSFVICTAWTNAQQRSGCQVSMEDVSLLNDEPSPKCFSRFLNGNPHEFTCFFMTKENTTYEFYYTTDNPRRRTRCELQVHRSEDGFLYMCSFPSSDIFLFDDIPLEVLDPTQNSSLYSRTVTVEDNILPEPPSVSIAHIDNIGELLLSLKAECPYTLYYKIRSSSKSNQILKEGHSKFSEKLDGLTAGEEVKVQASVRCSLNRATGHWSQWSPPVHAVVPQSADDISLTCNTKDLLNITCQWDSRNTEADYTLFYRTDLSKGPGWTHWKECFPESNLTSQCDFHGDMHKRIRVKLSSPMAPLNKTFYSEEFKLSTIVKTPPPSRLQNNETDGLCVSWDCPLPALSSHLLYELNYRPSTDKHWMTLSPNGPDTAVCLTPPWSRQFDVRVRAKPFGAEYSGQWSDWSDVLTANYSHLNPLKPLSSHIMVLIYCSPVLLLVFAAVFILLFSKYFKKLKQYVWPPVPDLDKVLQEFLTDLKEHKWDAPVTAKQFYGETTASVAEVLSEKDDDSGLEEASENSTRLLSSSDTTYCSMGQEDESTETELYPDYVALNKNTIILCKKENSYIDEDLIQNKDKEENAKEHSPKSSEGLLLKDFCLGSDFLNHSYIFIGKDNVGSKEQEQWGQGNIYTNMPCN